MTVNDASAGLSVQAALKLGVARFQAAGLDEPKLDARLLLQSVMGMEHSGLISANEQQLNDQQIAKFDDFVKRRLERQPVHRILGEKEFWGLTLKTSDAVLDPRADTECLIDTVLSRLDRQGRRNEKLRIVDIGTGSGAIALALASELPNAGIIATDISADALDLAKTNAERLGLSSRISFHEGSYFDPLAGQFDLIVSNPPYISTADILGLEPEVRKFDPFIALDGGKDGLDAYRCLLDESGGWLRPDGAVVFEIGFDQGRAVTALAADFGWCDITISGDYGGNDRVFAASR